MDVRPGQFQSRYKRNWLQQKCGSLGKYYVSHGLKTNQMKRAADTKRLLINRICKHQVTCFGHVMKREKLEHLVTTEMNEVKQREKMLYGLTNLVKV